MIFALGLSSSFENDKKYNIIITHSSNPAKLTRHSKIQLETNPPGIWNVINV